MRAAAKSPSVRRESPGEIALTHDRGNESPRPHHQAAVTFASPQEAASKLVAAIRERVLAKKRTGRTRHCLAEPGETNLRPASAGRSPPDRLLMSPCSTNTAAAQESFPTIGFFGPFFRSTCYPGRLKGEISCILPCYQFAADWLTKGYRVGYPRTKLGRGNA